jgi:F-box/TPR repeat protein Pof3
MSCNPLLNHHFLCLVFYSICLAVSPPWKRLLESSHKLWTTFDTSRARKPVTKHSLRLHLCRSNYTLNSAIISMGAKFDEDKLTYLTKTCKQLKRLEIKGNGVIGDSLVAALPLARNLSCLTVCVHIHLGVLLLSLETCQKTLVEAAFTNIQVLRPSMNSSQWPKWPRLESLKSLVLEAPNPDPGEQPVDLVCTIFPIPSGR